MICVICTKNLRKNGSRFICQEKTGNCYCCSCVSQLGMEIIDTIENLRQGQDEVRCDSINGDH